MSITTALELWQNWQTDTPLDVNTISAQQIGDNSVQHLFFSGRAVEGGCSRVYGAVVTPTKCNRHAILVVGSVHLPVDEAELSFWADKGYVAMGIDYAGNSNNCRHTIYPHSIEYANYNSSSDMYMDDTNKGKWYEYTVGTMRAVQYLLETVADKVSIVSYGSGARVATIALAVDKRIHNGAILFGSMQDNLEYYDTEQVDIHSDKRELASLLEHNEQLQRWELLYSPQSYMHNIEAPIYMLASGNSLYTDVTTLSESYYRTNDNSCLMVLPDTLDYCHNGILEGVSQWIQGGSSNIEDIELSYINNDGLLTVTTSTHLPLDKLQLWYCRNGSDKGRHWNRTTLSLDDNGTYSAVVPLYQHNTKLLAVVTYFGDIAVSSPVLSVDIDSSYNLSHAVPILYRGGTPFRFVAVSAAGEWHGMSNGIEQTMGYLDIAGARGSILATFAGNDGSVAMGDSDTIAMDICCDIKQELKVMLIEDYGGRDIRYISSTPLIGDGKWQKVILESDNFRSANGQAMPRHVHADMMVFYAEDLFIINNICMI